MHGQAGHLPYLQGVRNHDLSASHAIVAKGVRRVTNSKFDAISRKS